MSQEPFNDFGLIKIYMDKTNEIEAKLKSLDEKVSYLQEPLNPLTTHQYEICMKRIQELTARVILLEKPMVFKDEPTSNPCNPVTSDDLLPPTKTCGCLVGHECNGDKKDPILSVYNELNPLIISHELFPKASKMWSAICQDLKQRGKL